MSHRPSKLTNLSRLSLAAALLTGLFFGVAPSRAALAAPDATIAVTTTADEYGGGAGCALREAIQAANTNAAFGGCSAGSGADTITLPAGTYTLSIAGASEDANASGDLDVASNLTLNGAGADSTTIDGNQLDRVLHVAAGGALTLNNVTISNGKTPNAGASSCNGGGVYSQGTLTLADSTVSGNATGTIPGSNGCSGGGLSLADNTTTTIRRSTISGNVTGDSGNTYGGDGGGIYNAGALTIEDSLIENNTTGSGVNFGGYGGGVDNYGAMTMTRCTVRGNVTGNASGATGQGGDGGAIYNYNYYDTTPLSISDSALSGNLTGNGSNSKDGRGGGLYTGDTTPTLTNVTISGNRARGSGGGIYIWGGTLTLAHVTVTANVADDDNDSTENGGGLAHNGGTLNFRNAIIASNDARNSSYDDCAGTPTSQGYNLVGSGTGCPSSGTGDQVAADPRLKPLANNGGSTYTHFLLHDSPAVDAIPNGANGCGGTYTTDQRGEARPWNNYCDSGALESPYVYWDGGGANSYTSVAGNWSTDLVPTADKIPVFDDTSSDMATVQPPLTVAGWIIESNYAGFIQVSRDLTVNGDWLQFGGDVRGYHGILSIAGSFEFSGGLFRAPLELMIVSGGFHHTGGSFDPNGARVVLDTMTDQTLATTFNDLYLNDGLVGYWKLDEGAGTTAVDDSGYGYNSELTNSPVWDAAVPSTMDFPDPYALGFDRSGVTEYATTSGTPKIDGAQELTLSTWVYMNSAPSGTGYTYMRFISLGNEKAVLRYYDNSGVDAVQFYMSIGGSLHSIVVSPPWTTGVWFHVAGTYDGSVMRVYVDGAEMETLSIAGTVDAGNGVRLSHSANDEALDGRLDDVRIYNRALSPAEISALADGRHLQTSLATTTLGADLDVNGDLTLNGGALDVSTSNYAITVAGNFVRNGGVFTARNGSVTFDGAGFQFVNTDAITFGNVQINPGVTLTLGCDIAVGRNWTNDGALVHNNHAVTFNRSGAQIFSGATTFYDVIVNSGSTLRLATNANFGYANVFSLNGSFDATTNAPTTVTLAGSGVQAFPASAVRHLVVSPAATLSAPASLSIAGDFTLGGGFLHNFGAVTFSGSGTQLFDGAVTFADVTINPGVTLELAANAVFRVAGAFSGGGGMDAMSNPSTSVLLPSGALPANAFNDLAINDGLLGYWKLDEGAGGAAGDSSGFAHDGALINGPTWVVDAPATMDFPDAASLQFDGANDYAAFDSVASDVEGSATIALWVNIPSGRSQNQAVLAVNTAGRGNVVILFLNNTDEFIIYDGGSSAWEGDTNIDVAEGVWRHLAYTTDGATGRLYVDGVEEATHTPNYAFAVDNLWSLGQEWDGGGTSDHLAGSLDDVRIYDRALSATEIGDLAAGKHPQTSLAAATLGGSLDVNGDLTLGSGTLDVTAGSFTINLAGNFNRYGGVFDARAGAIIFDGGVTQTIGTDVITFYDITVPVSTTLVAPPALYANGTLTNNGVLQQTKNVVNTGTAFLWAGDYGGVSIAGADLGMTTVTIRGNRDCTITPGETVRRCYDIDPAVTDDPAMVHFFFAGSELSGNDCNALNVYHWNGVGWDGPLPLDTSWGGDGRVCPGEDGEPYSIRVYPVSDFSAFVLKSSSPTAVEQTSLTAAPAGRGIVFAGLLLAGLLALFGGLAGHLRGKKDTTYGK